MDKPKGMIFESIAEAIEKSGKSWAQISRETGIPPRVLGRLVTGVGARGCNTAVADALCRYLGLELVKKKRKCRRRKSKRPRTV